MSKEISKTCQTPTCTEDSVFTRKDRAFCPRCYDAIMGYDLFKPSYAKEQKKFKGVLND